MRAQFLSAEWRNLVMLNYRVEPAILLPHVPRGTELDFLNGEAFVSVVGFQFLRTRVFGIAFPGHVNFEEVNLRFYVRRKGAEGWRRGVVFVRELVPRQAIAFVARVFYNEPYLALPMRHTVEHSSSGTRVEYSWQRNGRWESLRCAASGMAQEIRDGSHEEFITEHYWGYTSRASGCAEYQVEHPRWRILRGQDSHYDADTASLYGERFAEPLSAPPASAFIADGSPITVRWKSCFSGDNA